MSRVTAGEDETAATPANECTAAGAGVSPSVLERLAGVVASAVATESEARFELDIEMEGRR